MSALAAFAGEGRTAPALTPAVRAAAIILLVGAACMALRPYAPWLTGWPDFLTLPVTEWLGVGLSWLFDLIKPVARFLSAMLAHPMRWANALLVSTPYSLTIAIVTALGWYLGGFRMALLALGGLGFVLLSGYWIHGMNTLSLVLVSVPLALLIGAWSGWPPMNFQDCMRRSRHCWTSCRRCRPSPI